MSKGRLFITLRDRLGHPAAILAALVLLVAAGLKIRGGSSVTESADLFPPAVRFVALQGEIVVALWLLTGWARLTAWLAAVLLFCGLTLASAALGFVGQSDCGCFGRVSVSPWAAFALDAVCLVLLLGTRPRGLDTQWRPAVAAVGGLGGLALVAVLAVGSPPGQGALARLRGEIITIANPVEDAGEGTVRAVPFRLVNRSDRPVRILGGSAACTCVTTGGLPVTIPAHGTVTIEIVIAYTGSPGQFGHRFELFTDQNYQPTVRGRVTGTVSRPSS